MTKKSALLTSIAALALFVSVPTAPHAAFAADAAATAAAPSKIGQGGQDFINQMGTQALTFLRDRDMDIAKKKDAFRDLLQTSFDMETIGRFTLGTYWRQATPAQQTEFQKLFREMVVGVYSARFQEYKGQKFEARSNRVDSNGKDVMVTSFIMPPNEPEVQVDWRVRYKDGQYKIVDVLVEGVSMSVTQRSDFASVIQRGGGNVDALLASLRQQAGSNAAPAKSQ